MVNKSDKKCHYDRYIFSTKEKFCCWMEIIGWISLVNYLCYRSWWCYMFIIPVSVYYFKWKRSKKLQERKNKLKYQFLDILHALQPAIKAGYSMEQAIYACEKEFIRIYGEDQEWIEEIRYMKKQLEIGISVESLWVDLGKRMYIEDVREFADIMVICRRSGGNLVNVMEKCERILGDKLRTEQEIEVTIAGKKFEQTIMSIIPVGIIMYMQVTSESFANILYHNIFGVLVMSVCLLVYMISFAMGRRLVRFSI